MEWLVEAIIEFVAELVSDYLKVYHLILLVACPIFAIFSNACFGNGERTAGIVLAILAGTAFMVWLCLLVKGIVRRKRAVKQKENE